MNENPVYKFKVIAGVHKNAELIIDADTVYRIGSDDECDIILMDKGIAEEHLFIHLTENIIHLEKIDANVFIDGQKLYGPKATLESYQIVTIGEAHFAFGPADSQWPLLHPPVITEEDVDPVSVALVPIDPPPAPKNEHIWTPYLIRFKSFYEFIANSDKKLTAALILFILLFSSFWFDFIQSGKAATSHESASLSVGDHQSQAHRSMILSFIKVMSQIREKTLVGAGVEEPPVEVKQEELEIPDDSAQKVREILAKRWNGNLVETQNGDGEIIFQGYDSINQMDLMLNIDKDTDGVLSANGYTMSRKQRKDLMADLGDVIRIKIIAADEVEDLCQKALIKKQIRRPKARFNIPQKSITLKGQSSNQRLISEIERILTQSLPEITIENKVEYTLGNLNIVGVSTSGVKHVKLSDGSKVFPGGMLRNGCVVENIRQNSLKLECNGSNILYNIGDTP